MRPYLVPALAALTMLQISTAAVWAQSDLPPYEMLLMKGRAAELGGDAPAARDLYRQAVKHPDRDAKVYLYLGRSFGAAGDWNKAMDAYDLGLKRFPGDPALLFEKIGVLLNSERVDEADQSLKGLTERYGTVQRYRYFDGLIALKKQRWEAAAQKLEPAAADSGDYQGDANLALAEALENLKQYEQATAALKIARRLASNNEQIADIEARQKRVAELNREAGQIFIANFTVGPQYDTNINLAPELDPASNVSALRVFGQGTVGAFPLRMGGLQIGAVGNVYQNIHFGQKSDAANSTRAADLNFTSIDASAIGRYANEKQTVTLQFGGGYLNGLLLFRKCADADVACQESSPDRWYQSRGYGLFQGKFRFGERDQLSLSVVPYVDKYRADNLPSDPVADRNTDTLGSFDASASERLSLGMVGLKGKVGIVRNAARGSDSRYLSITPEVAGDILPSDTTMVNLGVRYAIRSYPDHSDGRSDGTLTVSAGGGWSPAKRQWLRLDGSLDKNKSKVDSGSSQFNYQRIVVGLSYSYSLE